MISAPGQRASRRRQRGVLPAWSLFSPSRRIGLSPCSCGILLWILWPSVARGKTTSLEWRDLRRGRVAMSPEVGRDRVRCTGR
jgi:hypothetical protein